MSIREPFLLDYGVITLIRPDIAEVVINSGVVMDMEIINHYHQFLLDHLKAPFGLLINKKYNYTYTPEAQANLANLKQINAMAVVAYNDTSALTTKILHKVVDRPNSWNLEVFDNTKDALIWLENEQSKIN